MRRGILRGQQKQKSPVSGRIGRYKSRGLRDKIQCQNYPEDPNIKVALLEGSVMLYDSLESTILKPNQIAQYDKQNKKPH